MVTGVAESQMRHLSVAAVSLKLFLLTFRNLFLPFQCFSKAVGQVRTKNSNTQLTIHMWSQTSHFTRTHGTASFYFIVSSHHIDVYISSSADLARRSQRTPRHDIHANSNTATTNNRYHEHLVANSNTATPQHRNTFIDQHQHFGVYCTGSIPTCHHFL